MARRRRVVRHDDFLTFADPQYASPYNTAIPHAGVPNAARVDFAGRILLEHVLPVLRPDVALLWLSEPDIAFH